MDEIAWLDKVQKNFKEHDHSNDLTLQQIENVRAHYPHETHRILELFRMNTINEHEAYEHLETLHRRMNGV